MSLATRLALCSQALCLFLAGAIAQDRPPATTHAIQIELTVVECTFPQDGDPLSSHWPAYQEIEHLPGASKKLLDRVSAVCASGEQAVINHVVNPAPDSKADSMTFAPGESGTKATIAASGGEKGVSSDIAFQFRKQGADPNDKTVTDIDFRTSFQAWNDFPVVIHLSSVPDEAGKFICVIARMRSAGAGDEKTETAKLSPVPSTPANAKPN